jgi:predicted nucleotidyltransferase
MDLTEEQVRLIQDWAARERIIKEVLLFGSRAKGCARSNSDVDLAVTAAAGHYVALAKNWERYLSDALGLTVHVRDFARNEAPRSLRRMQRPPVPPRRIERP